jgi:hypothetical protein
VSVIMRNGNRRCDGVCHLAVGTKCTCICGGQYHGSAVTQPQELQKVITNNEVIEYMLDETVQPRIPFGEQK